MKNVTISNRYGKKLSFLESADREVIRWFDSLERMGDERIKSIERVNGVKRVGWPKRR